MHNIATYFLPGLLILIMLTLGLGLSLKDFQRVALHPRPVLLGLSVQLLILPLVALGSLSDHTAPSSWALGP